MVDRCTDNVKAQILQLLYGQMEAGSPPREVAQGLFNAFGEVLSHLAEPLDAAAYLRREASRIERMATTPTTETQQ